MNAGRVQSALLGFQGHAHVEFSDDGNIGGPGLAHCDPGAVHLLEILAAGELVAGGAACGAPPSGSLGAAGRPSLVLKIARASGTRPRSGSSILFRISRSISSRGGRPIASFRSCGILLS